MVLSNRAVTLQALDRHDEALASIDQALALKPGLAECFYNRANILHKMKRYDEAVDGYDQALAINPNYADAYNNQGATLQQLAPTTKHWPASTKPLRSTPETRALTTIWAISWPTKAICNKPRLPSGRP